MTSVTSSDVRAACAPIDAAAVLRRDKRRGYMRSYAAETYIWRRERGLCGLCGEAPAEPGRSLCWACRLDNNQRRSGAQQAPRR